MAETVEVDAVPGLDLAWLTVLTGGLRAVSPLQVLAGPMSPELNCGAAQSLSSAPGGVVVVRVGQLRGEGRGGVEGRRVVVVVESVRHVVRGPGSTLTLTARVSAGGGARLSRRGLLLLLLLLLVMMMVVVVVVMVVVSGLETAVVGGVVEGPGGPQLGWDVELAQVE